MIGLSNRRVGARVGMPVAAAEVVESFGESTFLSAFSVREGWWILAVRGGVVIRDKVFTDSALAKKEYLDLGAMPDWNVLVAPADWNAPSAVERNLADLVSGSKKYRLASISRLPGYIITFAVLGGAIFTGYNFFEEPLKKMLAPRPQQLKIDPKIAEEYKKKLEQISAPAPKEPPKAVHVPLPYESLPALADKANQCWRAIAFLSQQITGWVVDSISCRDGEANAHLLRNHGTIGDLYSEVRKKMPNVAVDETGGSDVILTAKLKPLETSRHEPAFTSDQVMTAVQSVFQRIEENVDFRRDFEDLPVPELGENEVPDTDRSDVPVVKIDATSKLQPREFIKIMDDVGSIGMPSVKWDNQNRNWAYEVIIYVK
jgi:hypothetical protein